MTLDFLANEREKVATLIAGMTAKGANMKERYRVIRYSRVVIDAETRYLYCKQAYDYNGIAELEAKYHD